MLNKKVRLYIGLLAPAVTILACTLYLSSHHSLVKQLIHTRPKTIVSVFLLYVLLIILLGLILDACLRICARRLKNHENILLNAYSLLANFFIPGQSGPAIRGAYLKKRRSLKIRNFIAVTLLYYILYAAISVVMLMLGTRTWRFAAVAALIMSAAIILAIYAFVNSSKIKTKDFDLRPRNILYLLLVTGLQAVVQAAIYSVELHSSNSGGLSFHEIVAYTGAANLALFLSLTPGGIGIRESILLTTRHMHHISSSSIVVANIIDRSVYLLFLLMLGVFLLALSLNASSLPIYGFIASKLKFMSRSAAPDRVAQQ